MDNKESTSLEKWEIFRNSGLLWAVNSFLHIFGYAIKFKYDKKTNKLIDVFPDRVKYRGFDNKDNDQGYIQITEYMNKNRDKLLKEIKEQ